MAKSALPPPSVPPQSWLWRTGRRLRGAIEETVESICEVGQIVAFGLQVADSDVVGIDSEPTEAVAERGRREGSVERGAWSVEGKKGSDELFGGEASDAGLGEDLADVLEETEIEVLTVCFDRGRRGKRLCPVGGQVVEGSQGALGPAISAMAKRGRQLSARRLKAVAGIAGLQRLSAGKLSWAQRASLLQRTVSISR